MGFIFTKHHSKLLFVCAVVSLLAIVFGIYLQRVDRSSVVVLPHVVSISRPSVPTSRPTTHPATVRWLSHGVFVDASGRMISRIDADGDGLYDADEILHFGTLRYNVRTFTSAIRLDLPRHRDPADSDGDGLPDAWELGYFGTLKYGLDDDLDEDGFPNRIEYLNGTSPLQINLLNPRHKPATFTTVLLNLRSDSRTFSTNTPEFWAKQEKATPKVKAGYVPSPPAVKGFTWKGPPLTPTTNPTAVTAMTSEAAQFRQLAHRILDDAEDTDHDGLPDAWERHYFHNLQYGADDDPDEDGFPNLIEWYRGTDPTRIDLMDPAVKPAELEDPKPPASPWDPCWDIHYKSFWEQQVRAAQKMKTPPQP